MKVQEGNFLRISDKHPLEELRGSIGQVVAFDSEVRLDEYGLATTFALNIKRGGRKERIGTWVEYVEPIEITNGFLTSIGWEYDQICSIFDYSLSWNNGLLQFTQGRRQTVFIPCEYVHELQNIFYVLKEEDLEITHKEAARDGSVMPVKGE